MAPARRDDRVRTTTTRRLKLVVVAHARSGSNSLVEILDAHPDVSILNEPFNDGFPGWREGNPDYRSRVSDAASLDVVVDEIFEAYTGIKVLGYQLDPELLEHLLLRPDVHVISLRRRNLLEASVSHGIAMQTTLWRRDDGATSDRYRSLEPIPMEQVREVMGWMQRDIDLVGAFLARRADGRVLHVVYEDVYLVSPEEQRRWLDSLWTHLGVGACDVALVARHLDPASAQMASAHTYGMLPNAEEIDDALGSDETGRLTWRASAS
jgi:hypothetical protein